MGKRKTDAVAETSEVQDERDPVEVLRAVKKRLETRGHISDKDAAELSADIAYVIEFLGEEL